MMTAFLKVFGFLILIVSQVINGKPYEGQESENGFLKITIKNLSNNDTLVFTIEHPETENYIEKLHEAQDLQERILNHDIDDSKLNDGDGYVSSAEYMGGELLEDNGNDTAVVKRFGLLGPEGRYSLFSNNDNGVNEVSSSDSDEQVIQGPPGPPGPPGPEGPIGLQGTRGQPGLQGSPGADGAQGPTGPSGPNGQNGQPGPAGVDGTQGSPGTPGTPGDVGTPGVQGPPGVDAATG